MDRSVPKAPDRQTPFDSAVVKLYDKTAESYSRMMDEEIDRPVYSETLAALCQSIHGLPGAVVDTACGSGHMLWLYRTRYDPNRSSIGIDVSPRMVEVAQSRLGKGTQVLLGDMRHLTRLDTGSVAAVINFFAIHHLEPTEVKDCLLEWSRILRVGGRLILAAWEGSGPIDYGGMFEGTAYKHAERNLIAWLGESGFRVDPCSVESVEEMGMDAVYLGAVKL